MIVISSRSGDRSVEVRTTLVDEHLHVLADAVLLVDHAEADARSQRRSEIGRQIATVVPSASTTACCSVYDRSGSGDPNSDDGSDRRARPSRSRGEKINRRCESTNFFVGAAPDLTARRSEVHADRIARVDRHRLALDGEPRPLGKSGVAARPRPARHVTYGGVADRGTGARPHVGAIHREDPL